MLPAYEKAKPNNILLVAITRMGDMLQASPLIVGLKAQYPHARLTVIIEKNFASICDGIPGIDEVVPIDLSLVCQNLHREKDGIVDAFKYVSEQIDELRAKKFDMTINMASSAYTALLLRMLDVPDNRGWISDDEGFRIISNPWTMLFAAFVYHSNRDFNSLNLVDIFRCSADVSEHPKHLVFEVPKEALGFPDRFLEETRLTGAGPLIAVQAGASQAKRQWAPQRFAELARMLIEKLNARLIFTGSKSEAPIIDAVFASYQHPQMVSAVGKTDLGQLSALLQRCDLLVTGDTGPMHLSVAVGRPVVSLFLASALCFETGPYGAGNIILQPQIDCSPCNPNLPCSRPDCHTQVSPQLVFDLVKLRLSKSDDELLQVKLPQQTADSREVAVYVTTYDADNFLEFRRINDPAARKNFPVWYFPTARDAYRALWKSEFGFLRADAHVLARASECELAPIPGLQDLLSTAKSASAAVGRLMELIRDVHSSPVLLGQTNAEINRVDRAMEDIGLASGILGAIIRMFIMDKENLRGDDALVLASQTKELYDKLHRRAELFGRLFAYYQRLNSADVPRR